MINKKSFTSKSIAILAISKEGILIAKKIQNSLPAPCCIYSTHPEDGVEQVSSIPQAVQEFIFNKYDSLVFIGAMGICIRSIAPCVAGKYGDPAVVCVDSSASFVVSVLSGHVGGANDLCKDIARLLGAQDVISTQSDTQGLWPLDTLHKQYNWKIEYRENSLNTAIFHFVNRKATALLLETKDRGTAYLERTAPSHVSIYYKREAIPQDQFDLIIAVSPFYLKKTKAMVLYYRPPVLHLGMGCRKDCSYGGEADAISAVLRENHLSPYSLASVSTIELKKDEALIQGCAEAFKVPLNIYSTEQLNEIEVPNPSEKVEQVTTLQGVSESTSLFASDLGALLLPKQKGGLRPNEQFTFAVALSRSAIRTGHIEIVGAGPGDPELISLKGKQFLEEADLILYAGSLVPIELTHYAKSGACVLSSADMTLEEQFATMKAFYDRELLVVRLHTGDPCIYGAIQEQMALFDAHDMSYHITPGISSFQAAAAQLRSQFTIPEKVQTIILTRGEGRTPMPEKEKLHLLAQSQSTMCIFLSASIVDQVQAELLVHYPPETPVAACYKLTWKDERIYRGQLKDLAKIVHENGLTLTTMIVVGEAIGNRKGRSKLYKDIFKHLFRP